MPFLTAEEDGWAYRMAPDAIVYLSLIHIYSALPHTAGQVVGKLLRHFAALLGNGIAALCQGDELLLCDIIQARADLKIVHQRFFHQCVFDLLPGNGSGVFDQITQQQPDLGAAGQPAGTYTGSKSIICLLYTSSSMMQGIRPASSPMARPVCSLST